ncbi:hypothetical protein OAJ94_00965 [Deltaproteobacteria bacterium]|nr:hypothetical protein [Deltaproteobacteria bacterium]
MGGRKRLDSILLCILLLASIMTPFMGHQVLNNVDNKESVVVIHDNWSSNGATRTDLNVSDEGKPIMKRPDLLFSSVTNLPISKTGATSIAIPELGEVWVMGGREDPNPSQNNDEMATSMVEVYDFANNAWGGGGGMENAQQYAGSARVGDLIAVLGDWWPTNSNPTKNSIGMAQVYNLSNSTWYEGASFPSERAVGNAGVAALGDYIYVAGGVSANGGTNPTNQTLRYDPVNDEWAVMSSMNRSRWGLTLTEYHGLLYAIGGANKTTSSSWYPPIVYDDVEVYDPANDTWWILPNMPKALFGHETVVLHDELVIFAGSTGSKSDKAWGYDPTTGIWRKLSDLQFGFYDLTASVLNNSIVMGTGDVSSYLYNSWGVSYLSDIMVAGNISSAEGWVQSPSMDLRPATEFTCKPIRIDIDANTPTGTSVDTQIRSHMVAASLGSTMWSGPDGTVSSWYPSTDSILSLTNANHLEYRVRMKTTEMMNWTTPDINNITLDVDHAGFYQAPPAIVHSSNEAIPIITGHHITNGTALDVLWISTTDGNQPSQTVASISRDPELGDIVIEDGFGLIGGYTVELVSASNGERKIQWNITLADGIPDDKLRFGAKSVPHSGITIEHVLSNIIELDNELEVTIESLSSRWNGQEQLVEMVEGGVVSEGAELLVKVNPFFPSTMQNHSGVDLESRLELKLTSTNSEGQTSWWNETTDWLDMATSKQHSYTLNQSLNGSLEITARARSSLTYNITSGHDPMTVIVDDDGPILISTIPENGAYINSQINRQASITLWDSGGLNVPSLELLTWVEAVDDGKNGSPMDGQSQSEEMVITTFNAQNQGSLWYLNFTINDSANSDHGNVQVWLSGLDVVAHPFDDNGEDNPFLSWQTREAQNGVLESITIIGTEVLGQGMRMEPGVVAGWAIEVSDANDIEDIDKIKLLLGGEEEMGIRWLSDGRGCSAMDERIISDSISCSSSTITGNLVLEIFFAPTWRINPNEVSIGALDIVIFDIDGTAQFALENQWFLTTDLVLSNFNFTDIEGNLQGEIEDGHYLAMGDEMRVTANINHGQSGLAMDGLVLLRWDGTINGEQWSGEQAVELVNGSMDTLILDPPRAGTGELKLTIFDEMGWQTLGELGPILIHVDDQDPLLLTPAEHNLPSRYHLNEVVVTASVRDDIEFENSITAWCQVRGNGLDWPAISLTLPPVGVLSDRSIYSFKFNMSGLGRPSDLPSDSIMACWLSGNDAAGREISSESGVNSNTTPWLELELTSTGPDLRMTTFTSDSDLIVIGDKFRVSLKVDNLGESVDQPITLNITMTSPDGQVLMGWSETKTHGLVENGIWTLTIDLWPKQIGDWILTASVDPDDHLPELNEEDNSISIEVEMTAKPEAFLSQIAEPTMYGGGVIVILLVIIFLIRRLPRKEEKLFIEEEKELVNISDPLPTSAAKPAHVPMTVPTEVSVSALAALDSLKAPEPSKNDKSIPLVGTRVADWEGLVWAGEYEYDEEGSWFIGPDCGRWKQDDEGGFTRLS